VSKKVPIKRLRDSTVNVPFGDNLFYLFFPIAIMTPILAFGYYLWFVVQSVYLDIKEGDKPVNEKDLEKSANAQKYAKL
jgi:hypothetical protein